MAGLPAALPRPLATVIGLVCCALLAGGFAGHPASAADLTPAASAVPSASAVSSAGVAPSASAVSSASGNPSATLPTITVPPVAVPGQAVLVTGSNMTRWPTCMLALDGAPTIGSCTVSGGVLSGTVGLPTTTALGLHQVTACEISCTALLLSAAKVGRVSCCVASATLTVVQPAQVPDLLGSTEAQARQLLAAAGLLPAFTGAATGRVAAQSPAAGATVLPRSTVAATLRLPVATTSAGGSPSPPPTTAPPASHHTSPAATSRPPHHASPTATASAVPLATAGSKRSLAGAAWLVVGVVAGGLLASSLLGRAVRRARPKRARRWVGHHVRLVVHPRHAVRLDPAAPRPGEPARHSVAVRLDVHPGPAPAARLEEVHR